MEVSRLTNHRVNVIADQNRGFATWIGGSHLTNHKSFDHNWVFREEYNEIGSNVILGKCQL